MPVEIAKPIKIPPGVTAVVYTDGRKIPYLATPAVNEVQTLSMGGTPAGGTFTITLDAVTSGAIVFDATAGAVQSALELMSNIGPGGVDCTGGPLDTDVIITFNGSLSGVDVSLMTTTDSLTGGTTPSTSIAATTAGTPGGGESIGDIIQRDTDGTDTQALGLITDVGAEYLPTAKGKQLNPTPVLAGHREDIQMQIEGIIAGPSTATLVDAARMTWDGAAFVANATGAHLAVGDYDGTQANILVDINVIAGAKT